MFSGSSAPPTAASGDSSGLPEPHKKEKEEIASLREELSEAQSQLRTEIEGYFDERFGEGVIWSMPSIEKSVEIQEGWNQRRIHQNGRFDAWLRESEPGAKLPPHEHPNHDRFIVLVKGKMAVTIGPGSENREVLLSDEDGEGQEVIHLPPGQKVSAESLEETVTVQVFKPPVAEEQSGTG